MYDAMPADSIVDRSITAKEKNCRDECANTENYDVGRPDGVRLTLITKEGKK
ncbi:MAG: hypothetical protein SCALA701_33590 [Candidatus Scalindua sp.]|nr:hypothetical protein [Planctomycetota bacterium]GJQ60558.1 MAG: hypothetical protein SCALA701_33590 [Candidatus Scalindua sp.]